MSSKTFSQIFDGYWREKNKSGIPAASGIYCVYAGTYNPSTKTVSLNKLIYIGESSNVRDRIADHEKTEQWRKYVGYGEVLIFNFSPAAATDRVRVEAAFIYEHKPPVNVEYKNNFPFDTTSVKTSGKNALLKAAFTVYRKENSMANYLFR